jgi:AcrR family transcriptional regulator
MTVNPSEGRAASTDHKLYLAVLELLRSEGVDAVTVERVATRTGVAKTTIYRRHTDRCALLTAAVDHLLPAMETLDPDLPRESLERSIAAMCATIERYLGTGLAGVLMGRAQDPVSQHLREHVVLPRLHDLRAFVRRGTELGRLRTDLDADAVVDLIAGANVVHFARYGHFEPTWPEHLTEQVWALVGPNAQPN